MFKSWVMPFIKKRNFQAYCVGTPKSGTTSLCGMLEASYRSVHEPKSEALMEAIQWHAGGSIGYDELAMFIRKRDAKIWLELESSFVAGFIVDVLVDEFPDSKFILTIRDCYSWLDSTFNHQLSSDLLDYQQKFINWWLGPDRNMHAEEEKILSVHGLSTLDSYLSAWDYHNRRILDSAPESRLLVLRTDEISQKTGEIAKFLEIPPENIDVSGSHLRRAQNKIGILSGIDPEFIDDRVNLHCGDLMHKYFPELKCYGDLVSADGVETDQPGICLTRE